MTHPRRRAHDKNPILACHKARTCAAQSPDLGPPRPHPGGRVVWQGHRPGLRVLR